MFIQPVEIRRLLAVRLSADEDVLEILKTTVEREKIKNAVIITGVGSVKSYHYHVVRSRNLPPGNDFIKGDKGLDIVNINGLVMDGRVHAHITFTDTDKALGGHLEPGCVVLTFAGVVIGVLDDEGVDFSRWDKYDKMSN